MSEFIVHGVPGSPFLRSVLLALEEKNAPCDVRALKPGDSKSEAYLKLQPFGRIPAFEHGDFKLYETQAILRYIDAVVPSPALQPAEPRAIARMSQIIGINDWYLFPQVVRVIGFQRIVGPALLGIKTDEAACAAAVPDAKRCLGEFNRLLGDQQYFAGSKISLADLMIAPQIDFVAMTPEGSDILANTALLKWLGRMSERKSMRNTMPPEALRKAA
ncbi:MAG TPA: glutathione S-transferase family protein [Alphaproteobacteria bacterium]|nr:glutathione S-transferase family protein [Alphaproteobacteria bacterium]